MTQKVIYDVVHGNIELSNFEALLLKNPIVNRLHQILQNSTAYTVYPNMKSSRFEHSLGTLNYAGMIYNYGLINSENSQEFLKSYYVNYSTLANSSAAQLNIDNIHIEDGKKIIFKQILKNTYKTSDLHTIAEKINTPEFVLSIKEFLGSHFIKRNLQHNDQQNEGLNLLFFQTIRLYGLLHDIGHLPLSHLFEFSLISTFEHLSEKNECNDNERDYLEKLSEIINSKTTDSPKQKDQIHEKIGKKIINYIFKDTIEKIINNNTLKDKEKITQILIIRFIEFIFDEIKVGNSSKFNALYSIVSSSIDADRLDFVQRDGILSGMAKSAGNVDRVIKMYCLAKRKYENESYIFLPSIQSINDVEELLHNRLKTYKYVVNHHAVRRSDYIHQKLIEKKLLKELESSDIRSENTIDNDNFSSHRLCSVIDKVHKIIHFPIGINNLLEMQLSFTQLTDFWLLSVLNDEYHKTFLNETENKELVALLGEVYNNNRNFKSLWKRKHDYNQFLLKLSLELIENKGNGVVDIIRKSKNNLSIDNNCLKKQFETESLIDYCIKNIELLTKNYKLKEKLQKETYKNVEVDNISPVLELKGLDKIINDIESNFIDFGKLIINIIEPGNQSKKFVKKTEEFFVNKKIFMLIRPSKISTGIKDLFVIDKMKQDSILDFNKISSKNQMLQSEIFDTVDFFAYYNKADNSNEEEVIKYLIDSIVNFIVHDLKLTTIN